MKLAKMKRISAIIERDMRKFLRSPALMMSSMIFPLMQLIVLGYAFGGKIKGSRSPWWTRTAPPSRATSAARFGAIVAGPETMKVENYNSISDAIIDLRAGIRPRHRLHSRGLFAARRPGKPPAHRLHRGQHGQFRHLRNPGLACRLVQDINQGLNPFQPGQPLTFLVRA
jgi:hypothetical protein